MQLKAVGHFLHISFGLNSLPGSCVVVDVHVSVVVLLVVATVEVIVGVHVVVVVDLVVVVLDRVVGNVVGTFVVVVPTVVVITLPNSEFSKSIFVVIGFFVTGKGAAVAGLAIQNGIVVFGLAGISVIL